MINLEVYFFNNYFDDAKIQGAVVLDRATIGSLVLPAETTVMRSSGSSIIASPVNR